MKNHNLIIKLNDNPTPNDCPICGRKTNPNIGAELFLENTETVICQKCGMKYAPVLACLISFADFSRDLDIDRKPTIGELICFAELSELFQFAETKFGNRWANEQEFVKSPMNIRQNFV